MLFLFLAFFYTDVCSGEVLGSEFKVGTGAYL